MMERERERGLMEREESSYRDLIMGMLTQLAAATAQKGTNRPMSGGMTETRRLSPRAVTSAPVVAQT